MQLGGRLIPFTKAHACGNDFLIVEEDAAVNLDCAELTRRLCQRNTGIGADGIEFFKWAGPNSGRIRLHNADGSVAELSGNGTRCVAAWMAETLGSHAGDKLEILTDAGPRICRIDSVHTGDTFTVDVTSGMGVPKFVPHTLKLSDGSEVIGVEVVTGNPPVSYTHLVQKAAKRSSALLELQPSRSMRSSIPPAQATALPEDSSVILLPRRHSRPPPGATPCITAA